MQFCSVKPELGRVLGKGYFVLGVRDMYHELHETDPLNTIYKHGENGKENKKDRPPGTPY